MRTAIYLLFTCIFLVSGCAQPAGPGQAHRTPPPLTIPETRETVILEAAVRKQHRAVMQQHLESVQQVVAALSREDFTTGPCEQSTGKSLVGTHLIIQTLEANPINLHLGPASAVSHVVEQLSQGVSTC